MFRRIFAICVIIGAVVWLRQQSLSIDDAPSQWMSEPRRFTKHFSWSEVCDLTALVLALVGVGIALVTCFPESRTRDSRSKK